MRRAVADRVDIVEHGAAVFVDVDPVGARCPRQQQRSGGRHDADADDDHVAIDEIAIGQRDPADPAVLALDPLDRGIEAQVDSARAVVVLVEFAQRLAGHPPEDARQRFEQGHPAAELGQHCRRLEPDVAAADDHDAVGPVVELADDPVDVGLVAHRVHARQVGAAARKPPRVSPGRPDQLAVADLAPVGEPQGMRGGVDSHRPRCRGAA